MCISQSCHLISYIDKLNHDEIPREQDMQVLKFTQLKQLSNSVYILTRVIIADFIGLVSLTHRIY